MAAAALIAVVPLVTEGCGAGQVEVTRSPTRPSRTAPSKVEYRRLAASAANDLATALEKFDKLPARPGDEARDLEKARSHLEGAIAELRGLQPPASVRAEHTRLIAGLARFESELSSLIDSLARGGTLATFSLARSEGLKQAQRALEKLEAKGYYESAGR